MKNKARVGPWSSGHLHLFSLHFLTLLPARCSPKHEKHKVNFFVWCFPLFLFPVSEKLRVAVDGDARQVVPDDLIDCKERREERTVSIYDLNMG